MTATETINVNQQMEDAAGRFSRARASIKEITIALENARKQVLLDHLEELRGHIQASLSAEQELKDLVTNNPALFTKPKTRTHSGVKFGYQATKASIQIPQPDKTIEAIRKHLPELAENLIQTEEKLVKATLATLSVDELRKVKVTSVAGGQTVVVKDMASDIDEMLERWMAGAEKAEA